MGDNLLAINDVKTHVLVMGSRKDKEKRRQVKVETGTVTIVPVATEKLLGLHIHESLKFTEHCRDNENSLFRKLHTRINALKLISKNACFITRVMIANSTFISQLTYMIPVLNYTKRN